MILEQFIFWMMAITAAVAGVWWLTKKPPTADPSEHTSSTMFILVFAMTCLLAILAMSYINAGGASDSLYVRVY